MIRHHSSSPRGPRPRPNDTPPRQTNSDTPTHRLCRPPALRIMRFSLGSRCLRGAHVRCMDTDRHQSATPLRNHCDKPSWITLFVCATSLPSSIWELMFISPVLTVSVGLPFLHSLVLYEVWVPLAGIWVYSARVRVACSADDPWPVKSEPHAVPAATMRTSSI